MSTETPRTDAATVDRCVPFGQIGSQVQRMVHADFARQLETELATERAKVEELEKRVEGAWDCYNKVAESDSVVASCNCDTKTPEIQHHKPGCKYRLITERDQALAEVARLRGALPSVRKLKLLADWIDMRFPNDQDPEIQTDLRKWADDISKALSTPSPTSNEEALRKCAEKIEGGKP